ncbi:GNAT family N-acetyltransferase [Oceanirhabdus seepicola]|uniref:GNAT family N-acetyltransferase n=1 Tax=Oceanirhabdus seepicola TaxID=2828781 RepID=A0A9J6NWZ9_9CLOT|nr:GNAT family N-acetyltransferase [Oceanirhabdus seepicola]MCM1989039.1 GNAT family N-acetyltransferase [Oceanirhabdus seepicola]
MFKDIYIETERLILKPYCMEDIDDLYKVYSDEKVMSYIPEGVMSFQWVKDLIEWMVEDCYENNTPDNIDKFGVSVVDKKKNKVIGWCGLGSLDCKPEDVELFYGLSSEYWGQGLATEAAMAMLHYGFDIIGLKRIIAVVKSDNIASKKVIEKLGMKFKNILNVDDPNYSGYDGELYYALTKDEYNENNVL